MFTCLWNHVPLRFVLILVCDRVSKCVLQFHEIKWIINTHKKCQFTSFVSLFCFNKKSTYSENEARLNTFISQMLKQPSVENADFQYFFFKKNKSNQMGWFSNRSRVLLSILINKDHAICSALKWSWTLCINNKHHHKSDAWKHNLFNYFWCISNWKQSFFSIIV